MIHSALAVAIKEPLYPSFDELQAEFYALTGELDKSCLMHFAFKCQTIGQCFAIAYRCALQELHPNLDSRMWAAFCVTEKNGNHPKQIAATVNDGGELTGFKSFVSMADRARQFIVIAKKASSVHGIELNAVLITSQDAGVQLTVCKPLGFIPEISHGELSLDKVKGVILEGDGHTNFSRPFRLLEDSHVLLAFSSMMLSHSLRFNYPSAMSQKLLCFVHSVSNLNTENNFCSELIITELFLQFDELVEAFETHFNLLPITFTQSWSRDKKLFKIATKARVKRADNARDMLMRIAKA